jgi:benzoyl-CoA reductase/2-hydroxyglutaryl-CoA dehydratase subunit BcrC/BadD/HgdB
LDDFLAIAKKRTPKPEGIRLGFLGVPPIFNDIYDVIESKGGRVVFNEVQRQFSMPYCQKGMTEQYLEYTYPYGINHRIKDIEKAIGERSLAGLIHYSQTFCYRQLYDIILREKLTVPILTLEGDRPGAVDGRTALRIETFLEMLSDRFSSSPR